MDFPFSSPALMYEMVKGRVSGDFPKIPVTAYHGAMEPETAPLDKPAIRLPLPGYAKWAVRVWIVLFLASPLLVFFRFSMMQILFMVAVLGGSPALGNLLVANPGWLSAFDPDQLKFPRRAQGLRPLAEDEADPARRGVERILPRVPG